MSTDLSRPVICPRCGAEVETTLHPGLNAEVTPHLREQVLKETLFNWTCPQCCYVAQMAYPCLYHDKDRKFMIYLLPGGEETSIQALDVEQKYPQLNCVKKRIVPTLAALKEKVLVFEAGLDDRAVELVKLALSGALAEKYKRRPANGYFSHVDEKANRVTFSFFFENPPDSLLHSTRLDAYRKSLEIVEAMRLPLERDFQTVDARMAGELLEEYQAR